MDFAVTNVGDIVIRVNRYLFKISHFGPTELVFFGDRIGFAIGNLAQDA